MQEESAHSQLSLLSGSWTIITSRFSLTKPTTTGLNNRLGETFGHNIRGLM